MSLIELRVKRCAYMSEYLIKLKRKKHVEH